MTSQGHGLGPCMLHNPSYDFNDELLPLGATYWVKLVERRVRRHLWPRFSGYCTRECGGAKQTPQRGSRAGVFYGRAWR
eukprot:28644-Eustigmatos_ZCMA.PRE.1